MESILNSIKKLLGGMTNVKDSEGNYFFDDDLIIHINSVLNVLTQLGVGPSDGYCIKDENDTWEDFIGSDSTLIQMVKTYVYLRVRQIFDPPSSSSVEKASKEVMDELEHRIILSLEVLPELDE